MNALSDILSSRQDDFFNGTGAKKWKEREVNSVQDKTFAETTFPIPHFQFPTDHPDLPQLKQMIYAMKDLLDSMLRFLNDEQVHQPVVASGGGSKLLATGEQVIEGVFNGVKMVGSDGEEYAVPPNYASKSKLVEGDLLKLTIGRHGQFIYKQIGPVERRRLLGELVSNTSTGQWSIFSDGKIYKVLAASVTFYKGKAGDEAVFLVPKDANGSAAWGAVENIMHLSTTRQSPPS